MKPGNFTVLTLDAIEAPEITEERAALAKRYLAEHKAEDLMEVLAL